MTRTPEDWRTSAENHIIDTLADGLLMLDQNRDQVSSLTDTLRRSTLGNEYDQDEAREATRELEDALKEMAHDTFDFAADVRGFRSGATLRQLEGREPAGYSKRDGGAAHDALYGSKAQSKHYARKIRWPLRLSEWDKETAGRKGRGEIDPIVVEGTTVHTRRAGGRTVKLVVDDRARDPPI